MNLTCPACNKAQQTREICQRCGCDLSPLQTIAAGAMRQFARAAQAIRDRDWPEALARAGASWQLCHTREAARLAFLAAGAMGDTTQVLRWRELAGDKSESAHLA